MFDYINKDDLAALRKRIADLYSKRTGWAANELLKHKVTNSNVNFKDSDFIPGKDIQEIENALLDFDDCFENNFIYTNDPQSHDEGISRVQQAEEKIAQLEQHSENNSGCRGGCVGLCTGGCGGGCNGCSSCTGGCTSCSGGCSGSGTKGTDGSYGCNGCTGSCSGCSSGWFRL